MQAVLYAEACADSSAGTCLTGVNKRPAWYPDSVIKTALVLLFLLSKKKMDGVHQPRQTFKGWKPYRYCRGYQKETGGIGQGKPKKDDDLH